MPADISPSAARFSFQRICFCSAVSSVRSLIRQSAPLTFISGIRRRIRHVCAVRSSARAGRSGKSSRPAAGLRLRGQMLHFAALKRFSVAQAGRQHLRRAPNRRPEFPCTTGSASVAVPAPLPPQDSIELIAPVALTSSSPVGMLRVTSSVMRSDSCARSCASTCSRASSFSCAAEFFDHALHGGSHEHRRVLRVVLRILPIGF